jgi:XTP/dITP diphosphohydrolase
VQTSKIGGIMDIVLATRNPGKMRELVMLLKVPGIKYIPVSSFNIEDPEETGNTFVDNAVLKATYAANETGVPAIADDSGLGISALNGFPGILSARCAGEDATDEEKRQFILSKMKGISDRRARMNCVIAFVKPNNLGISTFFQGHCDGYIMEDARGKSDVNIQYDSIFLYEPFGKSFAEMTKEQKNSVSHRYIACSQMKKYLEILAKK